MAERRTTSKSLKKRVVRGDHVQLIVQSGADGLLKICKGIRCRIGIARGSARMLAIEQALRAIGHDNGVYIQVFKAPCAAYPETANASSRNPVTVWTDMSLRDIVERMALKQKPDRRAVDTARQRVRTPTLGSTRARPPGRALLSHVGKEQPAAESRARSDSRPKGRGSL